MRWFTACLTDGCLQKGCPFSLCWTTHLQLEQFVPRTAWGNVTRSAFLARASAASPISFTPPRSFVLSFTSSIGTGLHLNAFKLKGHRIKSYNKVFQDHFFFLPLFASE